MIAKSRAEPLVGANAVAEAAPERDECSPIPALQKRLESMIGALGKPARGWTPQRSSRLHGPGSLPDPKLRTAALRMPRRAGLGSR